MCIVPLTVASTLMANVGNMQATTVATEEVNLSIVFLEYVSTLSFLKLGVPLRGFDEMFRDLHRLHCPLPLCPLGSSLPTFG